MATADRPAGSATPWSARDADAPTAAYGHRFYESAAMPWIVLAVGIAVCVGLYANALRARDDRLAAADRRTVSEAEATTEQIIESSAHLSADAARDVFSGGALDPAEFERWVAARRVDIHAAGATGLVAMTPAGADAVDYRFLQPSGLDQRAVVPMASLASNGATLEQVRRTGDVRLTSITEVEEAATQGRHEILGTVAGYTTADGRFVGWIGALLNPDLLASEVLARVPRLRALGIANRDVELPERALVKGDTRTAPTGGDGPRVERVTVLGQELALTMRTTPAREPGALTSSRNWLFGFGVFVTILLFAIAQLVRRNERRAREMVVDATRSLAESEERFRALVSEQNDVIVVIDRTVTITWANSVVTRILGYPLDEFVGRSGFDFIHPDDHGPVIEALAELLDPNVDGGPLEMRVRTAGGEYLHVEVQGVDLSDDPAVGGIVANLRDVTLQRQDQAELAAAQARFQIAFEHAPIGMALTDPDGTIIRANPALAEMLGRRPGELAGRTHHDFVHPDDRAGDAEQYARLLAGDAAEYRIEKRFVHAKGHSVWVSLSVSVARGSTGEPQYLIAQIEDVTERKAIAEQLAHQAIHDPTTGLPNRLLFFDRLRTSMEHARSRGNRVGVIFLDLDHFKWVNDSYGHAVGDQVLATVGDRLRGALRPSDSVARLGGDEFTILCTDLVDERTLLAVADRMYRVVTQPIDLPEGEIFLTASLGVAMSRPGDDTAETLLRDADTAMYRAKDSGRARTEVFDARTTAHHEASLRTGTALHRALERGEFEVHYQPCVELESGIVIGTEALVRWRHPERGIVVPADFVPLAESTGLIGPIGLWVLEEACRQTVEWQRHRPPGEGLLSVAVNLSPRQLAETSLARDVAAIIQRTGIDPDTVWLEITETTLMNDAESAISALRALRAQGLHLSVDDFGTGYSSLLYLKRFPVEALKVDRTFVDGLGRDAEDTAIVSAVVSLAHAMGLMCIAEGVESTGQLHELQRLGCETAQGYLFGRPRRGADLGEYPSHDVPAWHPVARRFTATA
jgi:diguanylate cyclase (GGDEF)-like protein/PAS domain S-box-containing protein